MIRIPIYNFPKVGLGLVTIIRGLEASPVRGTKLCGRAYHLVKEQVAHTRDVL